LTCKYRIHKLMSITFQQNLELVREACFHCSYITFWAGKAFCSFIQSRL
jgi:hypothetical protein